MNDEDVQRSLGRIEGVQSQILMELRRIQDVISDHVNADQASFSGVRVLIADQKDTLTKQFGEQSAERNKRIDDVDNKLEEIRGYVYFTRGVGWVSVGMIGLGTSIVVGLIIDWVGKFFK